jgi:leader peptidase (prepilin peptidase)/N-methyltransferase
MDASTAAPLESLLGSLLGGAAGPLSPTHLAAIGSAEYWGGRLATVELLGRLTTCLFLFAFGACVGSFLNVVVYRLPAGLSVVTPPSRCPFCGGRLGWRENLPVLGWLLLRGRCRSCRAPISIQYPLIEALIGAIFVGLYLYYFATPHGSWAAQAVGEWWRAQGLAWSWPFFFAILLMVAGLVGISVIDFRSYEIPIEITRTVTGVGFLAAAVQPFLPVAGRARGLWPMPLPDWIWAGVGIGGSLAALVGCFLLAIGRLPISFADFGEYVKPDDPIASYPFARREMRKELRFLGVLVVGIAVGGLTGLAVTAFVDAGPAPLWIRSVGASGLGFLVGGGTMWAIRVLGTALFGREAMGLGDVHLVAAVGAVLGWHDALWVIVLAPFMAIPVVIPLRIWAAVTGRGAAIPAFGPYLALATVVLLLAQPAVEGGWRWIGETANRWIGPELEPDPWPEPSPRAESTAEGRLPFWPIAPEMRT